MVDSHVTPHRLADWNHESEESDDGRCDEQLGGDGVNLSDEGVSDLPAIHSPGLKLSLTALSFMS